MEVFSKIVRSVCPVSDEVITDFYHHVSRVELSKGQMLIREGKFNSDLYLIEKGILRAFHYWDDKEDTLWFATPGDAVASMHSFYKGETAIANIEALTDCRLFRISHSDLNELFGRYHELANWGRLLAEEELYCLERRYRYIGSGDAYTRYCSFMQMRPVEVIREIPLKYIASYLGIAPQTLSKLRMRYVTK